MTEKRLTIKDGIKMGLPVGLGYLSVSIAFGLTAVQNGLAKWVPILISLTNFTGTGQFAAVNLWSVGAGIAEIAFTVLMINLRYFLLSLSVAQKLPSDITMSKRLVIAFGMTDENFAVIYSTKGRLTFGYCIGVMTASYVGWVGGTAIGALLQNVIPVLLYSALGIMIYAMFVAVVTPMCKENRAMIGVVGIAVAISCIFYWTPHLNKLSSGWVYVIAGGVSAVIMAIVAPIKDEQNKDGDLENLDEQTSERVVEENSVIDVGVESVEDGIENSDEQKPDDLAKDKADSIGGEV
ncbi:MAG: AzlC family ABC transporter permease [Clostridia bacterium]|nr:AzlC family ABC transporter permease [Clostridia bacterium]MDY4083616.1 AzlC family ABC transporter permease [Eubacteriales bacterium]